VDDDALSELLARALDDDAPREPAADRIAALRARAVAGRVLSPPTPLPPVLAGRRPLPWLAVAATALGLLGGFGLARLLDGRDDGRVAGDVEFDGAMTDAEGRSAPAELTVTGTGIGRVVELHTEVLPILPTGQLYEVWFVAPDDAPGAPRRISAGTFHPDPQGRSDVRFAAAVDPSLYPHVEVTAEPGDGDPQPTGPAVLRATIDG
jgi:hypothetical protein